MKKIISTIVRTAAGIVLACVAAFGTTSSVNAQSTNMPIYSVAALVSHDLLQTAYVEGYVSADSLLQSNGLNTSFYVPYTPNGVPKEGDIAALIASHPLSFRIANPSNDWINEGISLFDTNGYQLFYGGNSFKLTQGTNAVWQVPSASTNFQLYVGYASQIYESNAVGAYINLRDTNGNFLGSIWLQVDTGLANNIGRIWFQNYYAGQHGELMVTYGQFDSNNNLTNTYEQAFCLDCSEGGLINPVTERESMNVAFNQVMTINSASNGNYAVINVYANNNHNGVYPLVELTVPGSGKSLTPIYFEGLAFFGNTSYEYATGFTIKSLQTGVDNEPVQYTIPAGQSSLQVPLAPGVYHIDYNLWPTLAPAPVQPPWYDGDGAKG